MHKIQTIKQNMINNMKYRRLIGDGGGLSYYITGTEHVSIHHTGELKRFKPRLI